MKILVIIPAYQVAANLGETISCTRKHADKILVVDDGSSDSTFDIAKAAGAIIIRHEFNRGKGAALKSGFAYAIAHDYETVITLDGDGQHDPKYIPVFIETYKLQSEISETAMVIGSRVADKADMPWQRRCSNFLTSFILSQLLKVSIEDSQSGFRLINVAFLKQINLCSNKYQLETEIIIKAIRAGYAIDFVPIKVIYGQKFPSSIHGWADTFRWLKLVLEEI